MITNCLWYVRDADLHRDIGIQPVDDVIQQFADAHNLRLSSHVNFIHLSSSTDPLHPED